MHSSLNYSPQLLGNETKNKTHFMSNVRFYGIRHHGPGSALRLRSALKEWKPDLILIELPADAQPLLDTFDPAEMQPPVSLLIYDVKEFTRAAYFPLAEFSPEWQTLLYGFENLIACKAIDLPMSQYFYHKLKSEEWSNNPFAILASHSEFEDVEQWWDHFIENNQSTEDLFRSIEDLMEVLREDLPVSQENQWRENFMLQEVRKYTKEGYERIAVVCGAFHVPALRHYTGSKKSSPKPKNSKTGKTEAIWIPWSYERLTQANAYGAGVHHPTWYEALYRHGSEAAHHWIGRAISVIRQKGNNTSSAHSLEILRLAEALRKLRKKNRIGIPELEEALTTVVFDGNSDWKKLYGPDLYVGSTKGHIRDGLYLIPIQQDFRSCIKNARLSKILEVQTEVQKTLDLRKDLHRTHSRFLYQTRILQIPLASLDESNQRTLGTFKESWDIEWDPISEWTVVQAGTYGTTVESAARSKIQKIIDGAEEMDVLVEALKDSFLCGFEEVFESIRNQIIQIYAVSDSVVSLLQSLDMLLHVDQYGHIRWEKTPVLRPLIERIADRVAQMIPMVILNVDEDTDQVIRRILNQVLYALNNPVYRSIRDIFSDTWLQIITLNHQTNFYHGLALKQAMDQDLIGSQFVEKLLSRHFSEPDPSLILDWLEGLLSGHILWIAYDQTFLDHLNSWIDQLDRSVFMTQLPVLRKIFTNSSPQDRQKLFAVIRKPDSLGQVGDKQKIPEEIKGYIDELVTDYFLLPDQEVDL